jgi:hypothetical protein
MPAMAGLSFRSRCTDRYLRGALLALLLTPAASSAATPDLATSVADATSQLRLAWAADPSSASLPFPSVRLLPAGASVEEACNPKAPARRPAPTARYCAASGQVLLDRDLLADAYGKAPASQGGAIVTYWIATALAERLQPGGEGGTATPAATTAAASTLQANCIAGVLLGTRAARQASFNAMPLLSAARGAYGERYGAVVGSASQRGYALLSGLGATASSCSRGDMLALAQGTVPDPARLREIEQLPAPERAFGSLSAAVNSQCQASGQRTCPRRLASAASGR